MQITSAQSRDFIAQYAPIKVHGVFAKDLDMQKSMHASFDMQTTVSGALSTRFDVVHSTRRMLQR
jgi:hypothetical protein